MNDISCCFQFAIALLFPYLRLLDPPQFTTIHPSDALHLSMQKFHHAQSMLHKYSSKHLRETQSMLKPYKIKLTKTFLSHIKNGLDTGSNKDNLHLIIYILQNYKLFTFYQWLRDYQTCSKIDKASFSYQRDMH